MQVLGRRVDRRAKTSAKTLTKHITFVVTANAAGKIILPFFIVQGVYVPPVHVEQWTGALYSATDNGSMEMDIFAEFAKLFIEETKSTPATPSVLILDNHGSHLDFEALMTFREAGVTVLGLPPNTTSALCPLDVAFFGPFKRAFKREIDKLPGHVASLSVGQIVKAARDAVEVSSTITTDAVTQERSSNIISGFRACGIIPYDRERVSALLRPENEPAGPAEPPAAPPARKAPVAAEEREALFQAALNSHLEGRVVRKFGQAAGAKILTGDAVMDEKAQKILEKINVDAMKERKRQRRAETKKEREKEAREKVQAYEDLCREKGKKPKGRPPRAAVIPDDVKEAVDSSSAAELGAHRTKRARRAAK